MAEIKIIYRKGYCEMMGGFFCKQCYTECASDLGCNMFNEGKHEEDVIPFGDCIHAKFKYIYKGMNVKNYELEELQDTYNPHLNCMTLETINKIYECAKVILDGKCIYNELEERL